MITSMTSALLKVIKTYAEPTILNRGFNGIEDSCLYGSRTRIGGNYYATNSERSRAGQQDSELSFACRRCGLLPGMASEVANQSQSRRFRYPGIRTDRHTRRWI